MLNFAVSTAKTSGKLLLEMQEKAKITVKKKDGDFALDADYKSEEMILDRIRMRYPEHGILTEETGSYENSSDYLWVIDPLEGTLNYSHKIPLWGVTIGLLYKGEPIVGVMYAPVINELFYAAKGQGAFLNREKICVNNETEMIKSFFAGAVNDLARLEISHKLKRALGCAGLNICYVACGRFGGVVKLRGNDPYGCVATSIIVMEAGGRITDPKGKPWNYLTQGAVVSNGKLHKKLVEIAGKVKW